MQWVQLLKALTRHFSHLRELDPNLNRSLPLSLALFPELSKSGTGELLDDYLQQGCPCTTASSSFASPVARRGSSLLSIGFSYAIQKAIEALGACHWSRLNPGDGAIGLRYESEALRDLRRRLSSEGTWTCSMDPGILVTMIMRIRDSGQG